MGHMNYHSSIFALSAIVALAGCGTTTIEQALEQGTAEDASVETALSATGRADSSGGAVRQMTFIEKLINLQEINAARAEQAAAGGGKTRTTSGAELKKIARTHDEEALREIESGEKTDDTEE